MKIPRNYGCKKVKGRKMIICSPKKKGVRAKRGGRKSGKRTRGARMRMAKIRAAKMPGGKGPVRDRPAGRKILRT